MWIKIYFSLSIFLYADYVKVETFLTEGYDNNHSKVLLINDINVSSNNLILEERDISKLFDSCFFEDEKIEILCNVVKQKG